MIKGMVGGNEKDITRIPMLASNGTVEGISSVTIQEYPVEITGYTIEGNMVQNGTPAPDNIIMPQECGDRTLQVMPSPPASTETKNDITCTCDGQGGFTLNGTATSYTQFVFDIPPFTVPTSIGQSGTGAISFFNTINTDAISLVFYFNNTRVDDWVITPANRTNTVYRVLGGKLVNKIYINISTGVTVDGQLSPMITDNGQLPTTYEPYGYKIPYSVNSTTQTPIYLSEPLRKIGDYADTINNDGTVTRRIKKLVLDGTETWSTNTFGGHKGFLAYAPRTQIGATNCICSHYKVAYANTNNTMYFIANPVNGRFIIFDDRFSSSADWKSYLAAQYSAGTPVTMWYVLAEPVTESITLSKPILQASANTISIDTTLSPTKITFDYANYKEGWEVRDNNDNIVWGANRTLESNKSSIDFKGYGLNLKDYEISGNMTQTGVETTINGTPSLNFTTTVDGISDYEISGNMTQTGVETTINGVSPLSFTTTVDGISDYSISGNMIQTGTPDPDNIITPEETGDKTGNLYKQPYDQMLNLSGTGDNRTVTNSTAIRGTTIRLKPNTTYYLSGDRSGANDYYGRIALFDSEPKVDVISTHYYYYNSNTQDGIAFTTGANETWGYIYSPSAADTALLLQMMLNEGSTALPYEPYGYKIPITCASTTQNIYLPEQLRKIGEYEDTVDSNGVVTRSVKKFVLTGEDGGTWSWNNTIPNGDAFFNPDIFTGYSPNKSGYCSHLQTVTTTAATQGVFWGNNINFILDKSMGIDTVAKFKEYIIEQYTAGTPVTVWYVLATPITETITSPTITTVSGDNTLSVDTTYPPSNISLTYSNTGNPTPNVPITPYECGERTGNALTAQNTSATVGAVTAKNENGHITITGQTNVEISSTNSAWKNAFSFILKAGTYYVSGSASGGVSSYVRKASDDSRVSLPNDSFTLSEDTLCYIGFYVYQNTKNAFDIMINSGTTAAEFEPSGYKVPITCADTTYPIYLQEPLRKIGDYADTINDDGTVTRYIKKLVLTGKETPTKTGLTETDAYQFRSTITDYNSRTQFICSHMPVTNDSSTTETHGYSGIGLTLCFDKAMGLDTEDKVLSYIVTQYAAGTPVTVWYILAEPVTETITSPTITTVSGDNTLSVYTTYPPSNISLTYSNTGNPTPSVPIYPYECGDRTGNLWSNDNIWTNTNTDTRVVFQPAISLYNGSAILGMASRNITTDGRTYVVSIAPDSNYTRIFFKHNGESRDLTIGNIYGNFQANTRVTISFDVTAHDPTEIGGISISNIMLNTGSTALPYEPYGYKIPITCGGQARSVYLGQTQTVRRIKKLVLTGTERMSTYTYSSYRGVKVENVLDTVYKRAQGLCNIYPVKTQAGTIRCVWIGSGGGDINLYFVSILDDMQLQDAAEFKTWVAQQYANGTPVTVWYVLATPKTAIVNEPLCKIGDYADELHSSDAAVTIPTVNGSNTLTVDTTLSPSSVSITGHIKSHTVMTYIDYTDMTKSYTIGDVNKVNAFTKRRRCNMLDDGTITAFYGDPTFVEDGSNGQVMVYQPKFYYKVEPVLLDGIKIRKCKYYISDYQLPGYKLHPAFIDRTDPNNLKEFPFVCIGAYEGCLQNGDTYITDDSVSSASYKLSSIAFTDTATNGVKPSSGVISPFGTIGNYETTASNRGTGWHIENIWIASMNQLMFVIEMCNPNSQTALGSGVTNIPDTPNTANNSSLVGSTSSLGNGSGRATTTYSTYNGTTTAQTAADKTAVSYRGMENPFGNIWKWIDGMTIKNTSATEHVPYICKSFAYTRNSTLTNYDMVNVTIPGNGYVTAFGYDPNFDWLFISAETNSTSTGAIRDYLYTTSSGYTCARLGSRWSNGAYAGLFDWYLDAGSSYRSRSVSARICYLPQ